MTSYAPAPYGLIPPERRGSTLHDMVATVRNAVPNAPKIAELQRRGEAGVELTRVARDAAMLVLGHNPHGRITEFLFGDVTSECLRHAEVPIVLVPVKPRL
jgi:nucleotide-binding universal stress UspA family protein